MPGMPEAPPVRMVHLGIGNFHRAHQAWYTARAPDAAGWGIAGFTSRRPDMAEQLGPQDGLYTLITRGATGDDFMLIGTLAGVHPSTDHEAYLDYLRRSEVAVITITVTEVGYLAKSDGGLDRANDAVRRDTAALRGDPEAPVTSIPGKLVAGMFARRSADGGPISILSCDNLPENGPLTAAVVRDLAADVDASLLDWIEQNVDFATSMVDRITPATSPEDRLLVARVRHQLSQIAPDGSRKLPIRIFPTLRAERAAGRMPIGCATVIAAWVLHLRGHGAPVKDDAAAAAQAAAADPDLTSAVSGVLRTLDPDLPADPELVGTICGRVNVVMSRW